MEFDFEAVHRTPDSWGAAKKDLDSYHFGQVPRQVGVHCIWMPLESTFHISVTRQAWSGSGHSLQRQQRTLLPALPSCPAAPRGVSAPARPGSRYIDDEVDMCQSEAILRHIGRKHGLYGASRAEQARVDEVGWGERPLPAKRQLGVHIVTPHTAAVECHQSNLPLQVIDGSADLAVQLFIKYAMHKVRGLRPPAAPAAGCAPLGGRPILCLHSTICATPPLLRAPLPGIFPTCAGGARFKGELLAAALRPRQRLCPRHARRPRRLPVPPAGQEQLGLLRGKRPHHRRRAGCMPPNATLATKPVCHFATGSLLHNPGWQARSS